MSKHYYIESDRIVSKIGGGMENLNYNIYDHVYAFDIQNLNNYNMKRLHNDSMMYRHIDSVNVSDEVLMSADFKSIGTFRNYNELEKDIYFYHKDHIGSSTQITDKDANVIHHMEYMPSGELFTELRDNWGTLYKFNSKELDAETGLYYYGARYYTPEIGIWQSVDPLSDDYPNQSPFMFCSGNPVKRVDMNGMSDDEWEVLQKNDGSIKISKTSNLGGENSQIIHFSKENEKGDHIKTADPLAIKASNDLFKSSKSENKSNSSSNTSWIDFAMKEKNKGVEEIKGTSANPDIIKYLKSAGNNSKSDETPWCASFVHWSLGQAGIKGAGATGNSYLNWGVSLSDPKYGAVAIFKTGHVGFYVGNKGTNYKILHGNWSNKVQLSNYIKPNEIKSFRFPK